ncbi:energy-coupling factor transporter ATPase [Alkalibacillus aidingensis]|uniref:energy-coupling factor transporter ATPase n=1 Tax=Alkalibacillus aidingensis TaxID=2747607 RepID=UPI00166072BC|nr:energy-coupling factor transporter ATPase [Alkalibacillus aidingensis]
MDITFKEVDYIYQYNTPFEHQALHNLSFHIPSGSFTAIIGHTGSGKSTLIQHLNGLIKPIQGEVTIGEFTLSSEKNHQVKDLRKHVGVVFQYPEHQLFEETVKKDILFGPKNFGFDLDRKEDELADVLNNVGLPVDVLDRSPFELSGGQMRRVAIAGVIVLEPSVLVLDEPTAGLDPLGRSQMLKLFSHLHQSRQQTTVLVTHHMEDALAYADQVIVMNQGKVEMIGEPKELFKKKERLRDIGLDIPEVFECANYIENKLGVSVNECQSNMEGISQVLVDFVKAGARS